MSVCHVRCCLTGILYLDMSCLCVCHLVYLWVPPSLAMFHHCAIFITRSSKRAESLKASE